MVDSLYIGVNRGFIITTCKYNAFILNAQFVLCKMLPLVGEKLRIIPLCKTYRSATLYYVFSLFLAIKTCLIASKAVFDSKQK